MSDEMEQTIDEPKEPEEEQPEVPPGELPEEANGQ